MKNQSLGRVELAIYYFLIFIILYEWLNPIMTLTKTGHYKLILLFIALSLILKWLNASVFISWPIKMLYIYWFIVFVYSEFTPFSIEGFTFLLDIIQWNLSIVFSLDFKEITNPFRSILLFVLIWMLIYLIHYWLVNRLNIFYFLLMAVLFITTLDTFTKYDGQEAIVKIIVIGLIMTSFLFLRRLINEQRIKVNYKKHLKLAVPIIFIVGVLSVVSIVLPKAAPKWPDPVPYIKSVTSGDILEKKKVSKVGYNEDDSSLGGPFVGDDTVLFKIIDDKKQYWRVETKDIYTSKGWESSQDFTGRTIYNIGESIAPFLPVGPEERTKTAIVINEAAVHDFIIYPYGIKKIEVDETVEDSYGEVHIEVDENNEKFYLSDGAIEITDPRYSVEYSTPTYKYSELTKSQKITDMNSILEDMYLQLPDTLPQRVRDLAQKIVAGKKSIYEKAQAIEMYFRENDFRYDTKDVAIPKENQDYVDQFLFETKVGYCDNFSTSMVVLLRAVGIPARWVKGFVTGDIVDTTDGKNMYTITSNEAHSWVEAYIPEVGWVNFEPTIGFTNNRAIDFDIDTNKENQDTLEVKEETKPEQKLKEEKETKTNKNTQSLTEKMKQFFNKRNIMIISLIIASILAIVIILFSLRKRFIWKLHLRKLKRRQMTKENFEQHYLLLLKVLETKGLQRKDGQTLSSFAKEVDEKLNTHYMSDITSKYEQFIYSKQYEDIKFTEMKEIWEYLVTNSTS